MESLFQLLFNFYFNVFQLLYSKHKSLFTSPIPSICDSAWEVLYLHWISKPTSITILESYPVHVHSKLLWLLQAGMGLEPGYPEVRTALSVPNSMPFYSVILFILTTVWTHAKSVTTVTNVTKFTLDVCIKNVMNCPLAMQEVQHKQISELSELGSSWLINVACIIILRFIQCSKKCSVSFLLETVPQQSVTRPRVKTDRG